MLCENRGEGGSIVDSAPSNSYVEERQYSFGMIRKICFTCIAQLSVDTLESTL